MSVFKTQVKTIQSSITGEKNNYRVNNALFIHLKDEFGMTTMDFDREAGENPYSAYSKLVVVVLKANGYDTTLDEVLENTVFSDVLEFYMDFMRAMYGVVPEVEDQGDTKKGKQKTKQ